MKGLEEVGLETGNNQLDFGSDMDLDVDPALIFFNFSNIGVLDIK